MHRESKEMTGLSSARRTAKGHFSTRLLLVAVFWSASCSVFAEGANNCESLNISELTSPDAHWVARVYGKVCDLGLASSAAVIVDLARSSSLQTRTVILSVDMPSDNSLWPKPRWESSGKLAIQLPSNANIALQMATFQDVEIQVRFCPTSPEERSRWLAYRAAYRKWVKDMSAWKESRRRDPSAGGSEPVQPTPPAGRAADSACQL